MRQASFRLLSILGALCGLCLLAACKFPPMYIGPGPEPPPPPPLPPLDPDPLTAQGPGSVTARLTLSAPVLALGPAADLSTPLDYGQPELSAPLGLYPGDEQRPVRQQYFYGTQWSSADLARGRYVYDAAFSGVPLGEYSARMAWWVYTYIENYDETLRGSQFSLSEAASSAVQHLEYTLLDGPGTLPGRILLPAQAAELVLSFTCLPDAAGGPGNLQYSFTPGQVQADGRLFFELRGLPDGHYELYGSGVGHSGFLRLQDGISTGPDAGFLLNTGGWPQFQHWPRRAPDNMFFGFVRLTGAQDWEGDLRLAARPAGSSPDSAPAAWVWLDARSNNASGEINSYLPWYTYYKDEYPDWPPPGIGYGLAPLPEGSYDIYAELFGLAPGQPQCILLASGQSLPPADKSRLFRDEHSKGAPWWVALPLELHLGAASQ